MALRVGLAGLGVHGQRYARHLLAGEVPGARLSAISRADAAQGRAFADEHGLAFVADPRELATHEEVDAVVLVLPPDLHPAAATACLDRARPVLVEKPMAPCAADARRLVQAQEKSGGFLMVGQTLRFDAVVQGLKERIGEIGPLRQITLNQRFEPSMRPWIDTPGRGGMVLNTGVHGFDLLRYLTGLEVTSVQARATRGLTERTEDGYGALLRMDPGAVLALVDNSRATRSRSGRIELIGENGQLWGDHIHRTLSLVKGTRREELGPVPQRHTVPETLRCFVDCVLGEKPSPITVRDGMATAEIVDAVLEADRTGLAVRPGGRGNVGADALADGVD